MNAIPTSILVNSTGQAVPAELRFQLAVGDLIAAEALWGPIREAKRKSLAAVGTPADQFPQNYHWNWVSKSPQLRYLAYQCIGVWCDAAMQGLMMVNTATHTARLDPSVGKPLVYIEYLETAPWNLKLFTEYPTYGGVGSQLFEAAVRLSKAEGFHGRVGLHALPQALGFYQQACKMVLIGKDAAYQDLPYLELTQEGATKYLGGATS